MLRPAFLGGEIRLGRAHEKIPRRDKDELHANRIGQFFGQMLPAAPVERDSAIRPSTKSMLARTLLVIAAPVPQDVL